MCAVPRRNGAAGESGAAYLSIRSALAAVVISRSVEPVRWWPAAHPAHPASIPPRCYLRGFIPQGDLGRVAPGQRPRIFLDSDSRPTAAARVVEV